MNILLLDGLPEDFEGIPLSADYRNMIQVDLILHDNDSSDSEKTFAALNQLYPEMPTDLSKAVKGLAWFFTRGKSAEDAKAQDTKESPKKAFDFDQDASLIYAAFYATYNISLTTVEFLHWWEFMALFEGLPETTLIQRVMYWRTADLKDLSKHEKKHIQKMRKKFALKDPGRGIVNIENLEKNTKDRVARRFVEAQAALAAKE